MGEGRRSPLNLNSLLAAVEAAPPVAAVDVLAAALAEAVGAREVSFLIADFSGRSLIRLGHSGGEGPLRLQGKETAEWVPLAGTPQGRALAAQAVEVIAEDGGARLFAPVTSRGEAVGVLELGLESFPVEQTVADVALAAHFLAYVVIANRRYTDLFEWGQRSVPLSLAAEIQHRLLPGSFTCEAGQFTLAAWLQPAGEIGGDTFDFSLDRDALHLSMTDAMGHTMDAALLATVLVGGLRNARRRGVGLAEQARLANDALAEQADESQFVTGLLVRIESVIVGLVLARFIVGQFVEFEPLVAHLLLVDRRRIAGEDRVPVAILVIDRDVPLRDRHLRAHGYDKTVREQLVGDADMGSLVVELAQRNQPQAVFGVLDIDNRVVVFAQDFRHRHV